MYRKINLVQSVSTHLHTHTYMYTHMFSRFSHDFELIGKIAPDNARLSNIRSTLTHPDTDTDTYQNS